MTRYEGGNGDNEADYHIKTELAKIALGQLTN